MHGPINQTPSLYCMSTLQAKGITFVGLYGIGSDVGQLNALANATGGYVRTMESIVADVVGSIGVSLSGAAVDITPRVTGPCAAQFAFTPSFVASVASSKLFLIKVEISVPSSTTSGLIECTVEISSGPVIMTQQIVRIDAGRCTSVIP